VAAGCGDIDCGAEVHGALVMPRDETSEDFQPAEHALYGVAFAMRSRDRQFHLLLACTDIGTLLKW
jgi:hypothetical protein